MKSGRQNSRSGRSLNQEASRSVVPSFAKEAKLGQPQLMTATRLGQPSGGELRGPYSETRLSKIQRLEFQKLIPKLLQFLQENPYCFR